MRDSTLRLPFSGRKLARKLLVVVLTVAGILFGLVAMHSVDLGSTDNSASGHSHGSAATASLQPASLSNAELVAAPTPALMAGAEDCTGMCAMECIALGMACALALLTVVLLRGRRSVDSWKLLRQHLADPIRTLPRVLTIAAPPSLTALSISRT